MPEHILFPEFRDQFAATPYPFTDDSTLTTLQTGHAIDRDIFLDATLYPLDARGAALWINSITVAAREVVISIADATRNTVATATFDPLSPPDVVEVLDLQQRPAGLLVSEADRLQRFSAWSIGVHTFRQVATQFVPSCVIPVPATGLRGVTTPQGELLTGDVILVGGSGVVLRNTVDGEIRVDVVGDPLFRRRLCSQVALFTTPRFVKTINGCPGDADGKYFITVGDHQSAQTILRVRKTDHGLVFEAVGQTEGGQNVRMV